MTPVLPNPNPATPTGEPTPASSLSCPACPEATHLFFVAADNEDGENLDLLVVARDSGQAVSYWREYYELDEASVVKWAGAIPGVTPTCAQGPISWDTINPLG